jgi:prepilin-type N-terminal cleavage/methylation domain-containing protein
MTKMGVIKMLSGNEEAFTLVELMIVVAILTILSSIAIPRYQNFIRRSREGATKGSLGAIRSALSIYYGDNDGIFPARLVGGVAGIATAPFIGQTNLNYLDAIPIATEACDDYNTHKLNSTNVVPVDGMTANITNTGGWAYLTPTGITYSTIICRVVVNCANGDSHDAIISTW